MKFLKAWILAAVLALPYASYAMTDDQQVALSEAIEQGDAKTVAKVLDEGVDINEKVFAWSWLQVASNKNQLPIVKMLVERGAELNYKHPITKMTALSLAAVDGHTDIVKYLLSKGADPNIKLRGNVSVVRVVRDEGNTAMAELLMQNGAKDDGCKEEKCF
ncbi:aNMKyrin [Novimethylophilus kurashikiensis]|uniref:ANMKyrin n=1 Tax=Novimethylophilus kurashikiensis TaxID=1825523 RepID=A0A2R5FCA6_9PROT|nr:ankyrin repeat domain-containing protein [Novimethylophilus kurashikiensis]GBG15836.1 aNMKyrin [Novimethylophilus kurashikiensis]